MKMKFSLPSAKEGIVVLVITVVFSLLTATFVGFRPEHFFLIVLFLLLFFANEKTRKLAVGLLPFLIFGISYDWMRVYPNYMVNPIDVENLYNLEKFLFGIHIDGQILIPCEYFAIHNTPIGDFLAGIFYLGWVPVPIAFGMYLYCLKDRNIYLRFAMVFLLVNLLGFTFYYIYPAAPPWYAINYGFEPILNTPGNMAGLARFDALLGIPLFDSIYGRNANVFAAVPSLHSAYLVVVLFYAIKKKCNWGILSVISIFLIGIWFTAVYSSHHYIIDVLLGILCALAGIALFEYVLMKLNWFKMFFDKYLNYIK
ncbi:inositol phosphorylceramide synthase [Dysgonomonas sp. Marseille-P4677]|uniref:phosphatase PAP2 family protein n=1 Tax=Dysgonomonas sp. Marseille-P4677 TaxID=2364790 RepID=UPI001912F76E|nr:phosphatase PAP2 family protein [Dysgonomonas sp. Marseille-P4677]MBK5719378.1 inositol phosphorylceramide synthase [Dysgonomonas sp. Marseille-P4677]